MFYSIHHFSKNYGSVIDFICKSNKTAHIKASFLLNQITCILVNTAACRLVNVKQYNIYYTLYAAFLQGVKTKIKQEKKLSFVHLSHGSVYGIKISAILSFWLEKGRGI